MIGNFPDHDFVGRVGDDPDDPDAPCHALFEMATEDEHGFGFTAQCGHTRDEHPHVEHHEAEVK